MATEIHDLKERNMQDPEILEHHEVMADSKTSGSGEFSNTKADWSMQQIAAVFSLSLLYVGSQIPLYFVGGCLSYIVADIGGASAAVWIPVSNTMVLAAVSPFAGYLQDLFGRRNITLFGSVLIMVGIAVVGTAKGFAQGVAGMAISGGGAAIGELTALAGTSELVPVRKRGAYIGLIVLFLIPISPYVVYSQLLATRFTWRWIMWISLIYNAIAFAGVFAFYYPEKNHPGRTGSRRAIAAKIDYVGAFLSIVGVILFLVALQAGGYTAPWASARVLGPLIVGLVLIVAFFLWEWKGAKQALIPKEIFRGQRAVALAFFASFVAGMNFYSLLNFFPLTYETVYPSTPLQVGIYGLGYGFSTPLGGVFFNFMLSVFKGHNREVLAMAAVIMTAFGGALATVNPTNPGVSVALGTLCGFGTGGMLVPTQTVAISCTPDDFIASTVALSLAVRLIGGSIGYAAYYNVFVKTLTKQLPAEVARYVSAAGLPETSLNEFVGTFLTTPSTIGKIHGVTPEIITAAMKGSQWAYSEALRKVWLVSIPFGVLAVIACFFIGKTEKFMTNRVAAHIRHK